MAAAQSFVKSLKPTRQNRTGQKVQPRTCCFFTSSSITQCKGNQIIELHKQGPSRDYVEAVPGDKVGSPNSLPKGLLSQQTGGWGLGAQADGPLCLHRTESQPAVGEVSPTVRVAVSQQTTGVGEGCRGLRIRLPLSYSFRNRTTRCCA